MLDTRTSVAVMGFGVPSRVVPSALKGGGLTDPHASGGSAVPVRLPNEHGHISRPPPRPPATPWRRRCRSREGRRCGWRTSAGGRRWRPLRRNGSELVVRTLEQDVLASGGSRSRPARARSPRRPPWSHGLRRASSAVGLRGPGELRTRREVSTTTLRVTPSTARLRCRSARSAACQPTDTLPPKPGTSTSIARAGGTRAAPGPAYGPSRPGASAARGPIGASRRPSSRRRRRRAAVRVHLAHWVRNPNFARLLDDADPELGGHLTAAVGHEPADPLGVVRGDPGGDGRGRRGLLPPGARALRYLARSWARQ